MTPPTIRTYGADALLLDWGDADGRAELGDAPLRLAKWLRTHSVLASQVVDVIPGACTVLVVHEPGARDVVRGIIDTFEPSSVALPNGRTHQIAVTYDGDDLDAVATAVGCTVAEVVSLHTSATYRVAFCGFAPGFAYLTGLHERLHLPRRATPRTKLPPGSVAIASEYSAVYPSASPGGWNLLGTTSAVMWNVERTPPSLLQPGDTVRFVVHGTAR